MPSTPAGAGPARTSITRAGFLSPGDTAPHAVQVQGRSDRGSACLVLAPHCAQSMVVCAGSPRYRGVGQVPGAAVQASLLAQGCLGPTAWYHRSRRPRSLAGHDHFGEEAWPEVLHRMASWSITKRLAHVRAVPVRCRATSLCSFLVQLRDLPPGLAVVLGGGPATGVLAASHHPLPEVALADRPEDTESP